MKKLKSVRSLFEEIPSPIIWDILLRLPTKACLNAKLVCKDWYLIIISLEFGALRSSRSPFFTILLYGQFLNKPKNFILLDFDKSSKVNKTVNLIDNYNAMIRFRSKLAIPHRCLTMVNECNGLVCLKTGKRTCSLIVVNLLTSQEVIVEQVSKPSYSSEIYGLGCCPVSYQFKVVRLMIRCIGKYYKAKAEVCTIGTNQWRAVGDAPTFYFTIDTAFLNGALHRYSIGDNSICSFDFGNEQFSLIPMVDGMKTISHDMRSGRVGVCESCLSFTLQSEDRSKIEVWVMKEYGMKDSWVKLFALDIDSCNTSIPMLVRYARILDSLKLRISNMKSRKIGGKVHTIPISDVMVYNVKFSKF